MHDKFAAILGDFAVDRDQLLLQSQKFLGCVGVSRLAIGQVFAERVIWGKECPIGRAGFNLGCPASCTNRKIGWG